MEIYDMITKKYKKNKCFTKVKGLLSTENKDTLIFEIHPKHGTKADVIIDNAADVRESLGVPIFNVIKMGNHIFGLISVVDNPPNSFLNVFKSKLYREHMDEIPIIGGYDGLYSPFVFYLKDAEHILYAGVTNSGKSSGLNNLILSLSNQPTSKVNIIIIDVGGGSLDCFEGLPHLCHPIVKDKKTALYVLNMLILEMDRRLSLKSCDLNALPYIICVIDECVSMVSDINGRKEGSEIKHCINDICRRGRKAKIHIVIATQDASKKSLELDIANFTTRICYKVGSAQTSKSIVQDSGAESINRIGEFFFLNRGMMRPKRIYGAFVDEKTTIKIVERIIAEEPESIDKFVIPVISEDMKDCNGFIEELVQTKSEDTCELAKIVLWTLSQSSISVSKIKKYFKIGNRADSIIDKLHEMQIVGEKNAKQPRAVLVHSFDELSNTILELLHVNGYTDEKIKKIFKSAV